MSGDVFDDQDNFTYKEVKIGEYSEIISLSARGSRLAGTTTSKGPSGKWTSGFSNAHSAK